MHVMRFLPFSLSRGKENIPPLLTFSRTGLKQGFGFSRLLVKFSQRDVFYNETIKMRGKGKNKEDIHSPTADALSWWGDYIVSFIIALCDKLFRILSMQRSCCGTDDSGTIYFFPHNTKTCFFQQNSRPDLENLLTRGQVLKVFHLLSEKHQEWLDCGNVLWITQTIKLFLKLKFNAMVKFISFKSFIHLLLSTGSYKEI